MHVIWVGTRKGVFKLTSAERKAWALEGPLYLGNLVYHIVRSAAGTLIMATSAGHLGPALFRSTDGGKTWVEVAAPPKFPEGEPRKRAVKHVFWLTAGPASAHGLWYAGTSPQGLFVSRDDGLTWEGVAGFNDHPNQLAWVYNDQDQTPDGGKLHSVNVDPRDVNRLLLCMSGGGVFVSDDGGRDWRPMNRGCAADFMPDPNAEYGHDPHSVVQHPANPDRYWMQNHCGIYRMDRQAGETWRRVGDHMPKHVGDIGFPMVVNPRNPDAAWVFPMDGTAVWPRTSPDGKPAVYATRDGGESWQRLDRGFPAAQAWWTVKRQAMCCDGEATAGLVLGTTSGEVWASADEGQSFACIARHLPHIYSVTVG
ncbi:MAG: glycosyl hydrolase [Deltaproteobacteria bacterium]|nr:glycosyl hydrolase [Deltaproteobacteria bacterium]